jgi:Icc-related predicted phosphoesterase
VIERTQPVPLCFFCSDLHGDIDQYQKLFEATEHEHPKTIFLGGDLLPMGVPALISTAAFEYDDFIEDFFKPKLLELRARLKTEYPQIFLILGNDDARANEKKISEGEEQGIWHYVHNRKMQLGKYPVYGYSYVPPTPFQLKDWERYDVSRYVDPGCVSPEEGRYSVPVSDSEKRHSTIKKDLKQLTGNDNQKNAIYLFHTPPYKTKLDRAALDDKKIDHAPLDVHVGSIAVRELIETQQPMLTLHGHIHESARLTGSWRDQIGRTHCFSAAHDGPELALVRFDPSALQSVSRELI